MTTGYLGLAAVPNGREVLIDRLEATLVTIDRCGANPFNTYVAAMTRHRLDVVRDCASVGDVERRVGMGQVEELIGDAEAEHRLLLKVNRVKEDEGKGKEGKTREEDRDAWVAWQTDPEGDAEFARDYAPELDDPDYVQTHSKHLMAHRYQQHLYQQQQQQQPPPPPPPPSKPKS